MRDAAARKRRAARTGGWRIMVCTHLAAALGELGSFGAREKVDDERCADCGADAAGSGNLAGDRASAGDEAVLSSAVELPVALRAVRLAIDVRKKIPHAHQVRHGERIDSRKNLAVGELRGALQRAGFAGGR